MMRAKGESTEKSVCLPDMSATSNPFPRPFQGPQSVQKLHINILETCGIMSRHAKKQPQMRECMESGGEWPGCRAISCLNGRVQE